ncbi:DUF2333 family protein [Thiohalobacter sp. IOR34]|uniref:DUF2333 family protein n=1 Tax=Thiohalobacter sp. IOR34 TaxID=3057176 RepID=UPI00339D5BA2
MRRLYHPRTLKEKGLLWSLGLLLLTYLLVCGLLGVYWSRQPEPFDVRQVALERAAGDSERLVVGYVYTSTLMRIGETLLDKPGGYLSNDLFPPGLWLDNMPNWEFGSLVMLRDGAAALRNHFSRSQSQSVEDKDLAQAEPQFNFQNDSWILPATEGEYRKGLRALGRYLQRLADPAASDAQFYARADNLRQYLEIVSKRLGSLSQRLSASVGQLRINTDLAGETAARQATRSPEAVEVKTPWRELDDVFYEARGTAWALLHILRAVELDFSEILRKKNALVSLRQIIRELEATQEPTLSPFVLNGSGFGLFANYSLTMANYLARANAAVIDLRDLLQQG